MLRNGEGAVRIRYVRAVPTALLSVYDKTGIVELAAALARAGVDVVVSSGGTAKAIAAAGIPVTDVADLTGVPAILDHRVVTLHPKVHGGSLADPTKPEHQADMADVRHRRRSTSSWCNLYPFAARSRHRADRHRRARRWCARRRRTTRTSAVVVDPADYDAVLDELRADGDARRDTRRALARDAFAHTAAYDAAIVTWFDAVRRPTTPEQRPPRRSTSRSNGPQSLRYGENPHQEGARYRQSAARSWWDSLTQHGGKELSYLNLYDTEAAWRLVQRFDEPACVVVKHANPCGVAVADDIADGLRRRPTPAIRSARSAASSRVNRTVTEGDGRGAGAGVHRGRRRARLRRRRARACCRRRRTCACITAPPPDGAAVRRPPHRRRPARAAARRRRARPRRRGRSSPTRSRPTPSGRDLEFAWKVCAAVSSNAIVYAKDGQAFGIGAGQQNRLDSAHASPPNGPPVGPPAARARATRSSRSATVSTRPPRPVSPR